MSAGDRQTDPGGASEVSVSSDPQEQTGTLDNHDEVNWVEETVYNKVTGLYEPRLVPRGAAQATLDPDSEEEWRNLERERMRNWYRSEDERGKAWLAGEIEWEKTWRKELHASQRRSQEFEQDLLQVFRKTLTNATATYRALTAMSVLMFLVGLGLFVYAVVYASTATAKEYSYLFGGMGVTTFVAIWILQPFDRAQAALSNLMQAEICFMSAFEEVKLWMTYPGPTSDEMNRANSEIKKAKLDAASQNIERITRRALVLLERFVEPKPVGPPWPLGAKSNGKERSHGANMNSGGE